MMGKGSATDTMLEWAKHWIETAPLMGEKTKKVLLDFCKEWDVEVKLPTSKSG